MPEFFGATQALFLDTGLWCIFKLCLPYFQIGLNLDVVLDKLMERAPRRKDPKDDAWLTRCTLSLQGDKDPSATFTVLRDVIKDDKGRRQEEEVAKGRSAIQQKVAEIIKATSAS